MADAVPDPISTPATPAATPKKRRRWRRRLTWFFVVLFVLLAVAPHAISIPFVRHWIAAKASDALGRRVTIGGASAKWWSGIELRDVEVHNPPGYEGPPLL